MDNMSQNLTSHQHQPSNSGRRDAGAAVIDRIKSLAAQILPKGNSLYLYGSRARSDWREGCDWDLLVLLDKAKRDFTFDYDNYCYPFQEMGWEIDEDINARTFIKNDWFNGLHTLFYYNVLEDKRLLYES